MTPCISFLGVVGITLSGGWNEPMSDSPADIEAADRINSFQVSKRNKIKN